MGQTPRTDRQASSVTHLPPLGSRGWEGWSWGLWSRRGGCHSISPWNPDGVSGPALLSGRDCCTRRTDMHFSCISSSFGVSSVALGLRYNPAKCQPRRPRNCFYPNVGWHSKHQFMHGLFKSSEMRQRLVFNKTDLCFCLYHYWWCMGLWVPPSLCRSLQL